MPFKLGSSSDFIKPMREKYGLFDSVQFILTQNEDISSFNG